MSFSGKMSRDQAAGLLAELRKLFAPLSLLHAPLHVGYVDVETLARTKSYAKEPMPIFLLQQGIWQVTVRDLGHLGELSDMELGGFVDPFEAARNLLKSVRSNVDILLHFLDQVSNQPNAAAIFERCIKDSVARTVWITQLQPGQEFPSEQRVDEVLRMVSGNKQDRDAENE